MNVGCFEHVRHFIKFWALDITIQMYVINIFLLLGSGQQQKEET